MRKAQDEVVVKKETSSLLCYYIALFIVGVLIITLTYNISVPNALIGKQAPTALNNPSFRPGKHEIFGTHNMDKDEIEEDMIEDNFGDDVEEAINKSNLTTTTKKTNKDDERFPMGLGYPIPDPNEPKEKDTWNVVLWGRDWYRTLLTHSGCVLSEHESPCKLNPKCRVSRWDDPHTHPPNDPDVVIVNADSGVRISALERLRNETYRVYYWREPMSRYHPPNYQQHFNMIMSFHHQGSILNPIFFRSPSYLLKSEITSRKPMKDRPFFAMSLISDCDALSLRDTYIERIAQHVGQGKVHRYGQCGDGTYTLPYSNIAHNLKITIEKYLFFFAFENRIMEGYLSEKLIRSLTSGSVPVYYGDPTPVNITKKPSYINAHDFSTPGHLAEYLLFLSKNPKEYNKYLEWRDEADPWNDDFKYIVNNHMPRNEELAAIRHMDSMWGAMRRVSCCRLCNPSHVKKVSERNNKRGRESYPKAWGVHKIREVFGL